ncbi:regulatory protein Ral2 [Rhodotorula toruloides]|uniref:Regulatory protein Ral2 n=1 Tax=Rhodotorula toruloides TaxID=5286 RepID=A0A511KNI2_RHOTO|nr:regulatory protein Ral2 [Rhodotorula toruloides]
MADWVDLTSTVRKTKGDVPPPLVGASVTLVGDSIYVFGGRPVASREMVDTLFALDLRRLAWNKLWPPTSPSASSAKGPTPRYFHSAAAWEDKLVVFGGQRFVPSSGTSKGDGHLETLDELLVWDTKKQSWLFPNTAVRNGARRPTPRYAHLSVVSTVSTEPIVLCPPSSSSSSSSSGSRQPSDTSTSSRLVIIGGQDYENNYVSDLSILDLSSMEWVSHAPYPRKAGTYRSVAAVAAVGVRPREERGANVVSSWAERPTEEREEPVYVFSNTNFAAPRRDFDRIPTLHDSLPSPAYTPLADSLTGDSLPPGLRFPHAYICGTHLVLSGADVGPDSAQFVVWTLELGKMRWERIPVEKVFGKRSWGPAVGWRNTLVVVGAGERHLLEDYASRQTNFSQVAFVDLEGFGVYVPPSQSLPPAQQQLGLVQLSQTQLHDFVIVCSNKERLGCSRRVLEARWPWFAEELEAVRTRHEAACEAREQSAVIGGSVGFADSSDDEPIDGALQRASSPLPTRQAPRSAATIRPPSRIFPLTPSTLDLPLPSSDVKALLQYLYSLSLLTPLQRSLPTLSSFLSFTKTYDIVLPSLRTLIVHALHETLDDHPESAAKVYEAAALGDSVALQIRAMQVMLKGGVAGDATSSLSAYSGLESSSDHGHSNVLRSPASHASSPPSSVYNGSGISSFKLTTPSSSLPPLPPHASPLPPLPQQNASLPSLPPPITQAPLPQPPSAQHSAPHSSYPASRPSYPVSRVQPSGRTSSLGVLSETSDASTFSHVPSQPPHARQVHSPTPLMAISSSTPARIAEAWREAEERDRQQRAEAHRLAAEAELARSAAALRLQTERKGSTVCVTFTPAPADQAAREFATSPPPPAVSPTPIVSEMYHQAGDTGSIRTNGSSGSGGTKVSSEKVTQTAAVAVKAVKKGFFSSLIAGPTMHNAGVQRAVPTGPPVRKTYPAPRARTAKGAQALAAKAVVDDGASAVSGLSSSGSSGASFRL